MKSNCSALQEWLRENRTGSKFYIDRIRVRVNDISALEDVKRWHRKLPGSANVAISPNFERGPKYVRRPEDVGGQHVGFTVDLQQPPIKSLDELGRILVKSHYTISWIEIAYDINTPSQEDALELLDVLSRMVVVPRVKRTPTFRDQKGEVPLSDETPIRSAYFGRYEDRQMYKMYIPKAGEKVFGDTSVHSEFRINGAESIRRIGIFTLTDLKPFDVSTWYAANALIRGVNKTKTGQLLRAHEGKPAASDKQCQKDFDRKFRPERAVSHKVNHHEKGVLRDGLIDCGAKWLARKT